MNMHGLNESSEIDAVRVGRLAAIGGVVFLLALFASFALWMWWLKPANPVAKSQPRSQPAMVAPEQLRAQQQQRLQEYGWVNEAAGIARIPVNRAMELLLSPQQGTTTDGQESDRGKVAPGAEP